MTCPKHLVKNFFLDSGIRFTDEELESIEYADFGLNRFEEEGLSLIVYENNERYCAKEMVLLPGQICPEHIHPDRNGEPGKQETFRCRKGSVYLFVEDIEENQVGDIHVPEVSKEYYTVKNGILLEPGEQYTIRPGLKHWFKGGPTGAVVSEFSSNSDDASDIFINPDIRRVQ